MENASVGVLDGSTHNHVASAGPPLKGKEGVDPNPHPRLRAACQRGECLSTDDGPRGSRSIVCGGLGHAADGRGR